MMQSSYFDGGLFHYILLFLFGTFITVISFGILYPWSLTMIYRWRIEHTVIEGRRLEFHGTALGLFGHWIKWLFLTLITLGIYGFWVFIKLEDWKVRHTTFNH